MGGALRRDGQRDKWDTVNQPTLPDSGATAFLPAGVNLSSVVFSKNAGRDTATYQLFPDHIDVYSR